MQESFIFQFLGLFWSFHMFPHDFFTTQILLVSEMTIHPGFLETVFSRDMEPSLLKSRKSQGQ